jgi:hypothetical protein
LFTLNLEITVADVVAEFDFAKTGPHLRWELQQVMSRVRPEDLSAAEVSGLLAILVPAHSRVIGGPAGRPGLLILRAAGEHSAAELAQ